MRKREEAVRKVGKRRRMRGIYDQRDEGEENWEIAEETTMWIM